MSKSQVYEWECEPDAEKLLLNIYDECCRANSFIGELQEDFRKHTSLRLFDCVDHFVVGHSPNFEKGLEESGFISDHATPSYRVFFHPAAQLPRVVVKDHDQAVVGMAVKVESIGDFLLVRGMSGWIEGTPFSGYRRCCLSTDNDISLWVVERRLHNTMEATYPEEGYVEKYLEAREKWQSRPRELEDDEEAISRALSIAEELVIMLGEDLAAWVVLECERKYWQSRNFAGQIQKNRQDSLGLGWNNLDHHTFRSSRKNFPMLVRLFEMLGFHCRERFYAGGDAGWGAQVMENPNCGLALFLDLDLSPEELKVDFVHHPIQELNHLGTVGLWCALHGDSILKGGMHHIGAHFLFENLTEDLSHHGIGMMDPFSDFLYLKQAFTHGEVWFVDPKRVSHLVERGIISHEEADRFTKYGIVGSHLENLQRREGYKGFNRENVSYIIQKTDPRAITT